MLRACVALGLNIQFGYGGLFNFGIMGLRDDRRHDWSALDLYPAQRRLLGLGRADDARARRLRGCSPGAALVLGAQQLADRRHRARRDVADRAGLDRRLCRLSHADRSGRRIHRDEASGGWVGGLGSIRSARLGRSAGSLAGWRRLCHRQDLRSGFAATISPSRPSASREIIRALHQEHGLADARHADRVADPVADAAAAGAAGAGRSHHRQSSSSGG